MDIFYHGTDEDLTGDIEPLYLTPSKALAEMNGKNVYAFSIKPDAEWFDMSQVEYSLPSMDSLGYNQVATEKLQNKGYDVVWDSEDYAKGAKQLFVINPDVLKRVETTEEAFMRDLNRLFENEENEEREHSDEHVADNTKKVVVGGEEKLLMMDDEEITEEELYEMIRDAVRAELNEFMNYNT